MRPICSIWRTGSATGLLTASSRHAAILAANAGLAPAILAPALDRIMRAVLTDLHDRYRSAGDPPRQ